MLISNCCNAPPFEFFDIQFDFPHNPSGLCGDCKDHCEFIDEDEIEE